MPAALTDIVRPFLWLAALGFTIGFAGYLMLAAGAQAFSGQDGSAGRADAAQTLSLAREAPRLI